LIQQGEKMQELKKKKIIAAGIDFGAINTGVSYFSFSKDDAPHQTLPEAELIITDKNIKWLLVDRREKRHTKRNLLRREKSKKLLWELLLSRDIYKETLPFALQEELMGLMNRRGFTFQENELSTEDWSEDLCEFLDDYLEDSNIGNARGTTIVEKIKNYTNEYDEKLKTLLKAKPKKTSSEEPPQWVKKYKWIKDHDSKKYSFSEKLLASAIKAIRESLETRERESLGNYPREEYLKLIKSDIAHYYTQDHWKPLRDKFSKDEFSCLVGNIANLQLRFLRKYFHDEQRKNNPDRGFQASRFAWLYLRTIRNFHAKETDEVDRKRQTIKALSEHNLASRQTALTASSTQILKFLCSLDPHNSIPPYEDQNNRNIERCPSLYLNPRYLDKHYPSWKTHWIGSSIEKYFGNLPLSKDLNLSIEKDALIFLHRVLDVRNVSNPFKFIDVQKKKKEIDIILNEAPFAELNEEKRIAFKELYEFYRKYTGTISQAKKGLSNDTDLRNILKRCNHQVPHKNKVVEISLGRIIGKQISPEDVKNFREGPWAVPRSIKSVCRRCAELQKQHGYETKKCFTEQLKFSTEIKKLCTDITNASKKIAEHFESPPTKERTCDEDLFILTQIFNILESDLHGFASSCLQCAKENLWRNQQYGEKGVHAISLRIDSVAPIDGVINKLVSFVAGRISSHILKIAQKLELTPDEELHIYLFPEENKFSQVEELSSLKGKRLKESIKKAVQQKEYNFQEKDGRIQNDSPCCPYTGETIQSGGEIDHIIPRSFSKKRYGTVINHEINLIYASRMGNQKKKNKTPEFEDLHPNYLKNVFNTTDKSTITHSIRAVIEMLDKNPHIDLSLFEPKKRNYLRVGLFISELQQEIANLLLRNSTRARVNGSQRYLAKQIVKKVRRNYPYAQSSLFLQETEEIRKIRKDLEERGIVEKKKTPQPAFSHIIDANISLFLGLNQEGYATFISQGPEEFLPKQFHIIRAQKKKISERTRPSDIARLSLMHAGMYENHFLNCIITKDSWGFGFSPRPHAYIPIGKKYSEHSETYDAIKPFFSLKEIFKNKTLSELQDHVQETRNPLIFKFNNRKTVEYLFNTHQQYGQTLSYEAKILENCHYFTQRKDITDQFFKDKNNKRTFTAPIFEKRFSFRIRKEEHSDKYKTFEKKLSMPFNVLWEKLNQDITTQNREEFSRNLAQHTLFKNRKQETGKKKHRYHKRAYALPIVPTLPGTPLWQRSYNPIKREFVYQLICSDESVCVGFDAKGNEQLHPHFQKSKNLAPYKGNMTEIYSGNVSHSFTMPIPIPINHIFESLGIRKLSYKIFTKARGEYSMEITSNNFLPLMRNKENNITSWQLCLHSFKIDLSTPAYNKFFSLFSKGMQEFFNSQNKQVLNNNINKLHDSAKQKIPIKFLPLGIISLNSISSEYINLSFTAQGQFTARELELAKHIKK